MSHMVSSRSRLFGTGTGRCRCFCLACLLGRFDDFRTYNIDSPVDGSCNDSLDGLLMNLHVQFRYFLSGFEVVEE